MLKQILKCFFYVFKNEIIVVLPGQSRFPAKLIRCIAFESASSACCLLNSTAINL